MDATAQRPIVIGGDNGKFGIVGIRYWLLVLANMSAFLFPVLPQTEAEMEIVKRWLRAHGYPSYANWRSYCEITHRSLTQPVIEERVVVLQGEVVDDEPCALPASRGQLKALPAAGAVLRR